MILVSVGPSAGALEAPRIVRELAAAGHDVEVFLEPGARRFVGPGVFPDPRKVVESASGVPEALVFVPAVTETVARLARGLDPGLSVPRGVPVFVVPDLDAATAGHPAVVENLDFLRGDCRRVVLGLGGGMAGADEVVAAVLGGLGGPMDGLRVLVTAGGTHESLDSVRFIGNRSSGKMGVAVAREALRLGADVAVVAANVERTEPGVEWRSVETVEELREEVLRRAFDADVLVMAAAVSDFTPASPARQKIRRGEGGLSIELKPTTDILGAVSGQNPDLFVVGFAATHGDPVPDAREKLRRKGADMIVGNDISREGLGFGAEENEVHLVSHGGERFVPRATKSEVARVILERIMAEIGEERQR